MAEKIKLLELDIDVESIISKSAFLKKSLDAMGEEMKELKSIGDTSSDAFIKLDASIKKTSAEYRINQTQLSNLMGVNSQYLTVQQKMTLGLDKEINSISAARKNTSELIKVRNELNLNTADGAKAAELINAKINQNNDFIKANVSSLEQQKIGIGGYKDAIKEALQETGVFGGEVQKVTQVFNSFAPVFNTLNQDIKNTWAQMNIFGQASENAAGGVSTLADGTRRLTQETSGASAAQRALTIATNVGTGAMRIFALAVAATGIGAIVIAVALLIGYLKTFTPIVDVVEQSMAGLGAVIKVVQQGVMSFIDGLSDLQGTLTKVAKFLSNPIKGFKEMGSAMGEAYNSAARLKKEMQDLEDAIEAQEIASAKNRAEINRLNVMAKDRTKSEAERIKLLEEAARIEKADFEQRKANNIEQLRIAEQQIINEAKLTEAEIAELKKRGFAYKEYVETKTNNTDELFDNLKNAILAQTDLENEFNANYEKNIVKQNKIIEDQEAKRTAAAQKAQEARQKALQDAVALSQAELDLMISKEGFRSKSDQEEIESAERTMNKLIEIARKEYEASEKSASDRLNLLAKENDAKDQYLQKMAEVAVANGARELDAYIKANSAKIDSTKFFTELALQEEQRRIDGIAKMNEEFAALQFENGIINEQKYQDEIQRIQDEARVKKEDAQALRDEAEKERKAIDLENQLLLDEELFQGDLEVQLRRLDQRRAAEIENAEKTGANIDLINKRYAAAAEAMDRQRRASQIGNAQQAVGEIGQLMEGFFGENKSLSAALAGADAILGAQKAYVSQLIPGDPTSVARATLAAVKAGAFGALNVAKILKLKFEEGGALADVSRGKVLSGPSHDNGGIPFTVQGRPGFEAEGDEIILTKNVFRNPYLRRLASRINVAAGGVAFAGGGVPYPSTTINNMVSNLNSASLGIDYDLLAEKLSSANASIPTPVVYAAVTDINRGQKEYADIVDGASF